MSAKGAQRGGLAGGAGIGIPAGLPGRWGTWDLAMGPVEGFWSGS